MSRAKLGLITVIIILVVVIIAAIIIFLLGRQTNLNTPTNQVANTTQQNTNISNINSVNLNQNINALPPETVAQAQLATIAQNFAERFGSYSNQNNFDNILNLQDLMTEKMKKWSEEYVATEKAKITDTSVYYGVTTKALSYQKINFEMDKSAGFIVTTQRVEATGTTTNITKTYYQDITILLIKENNAWKVDEAKWGETTL